MGVMTEIHYNNYQDRRVMTPIDYEFHVPTAPDQGLPAEFLEEVARALRQREVIALVDYPGILHFGAHGREWNTGLTGLHTSDHEGHGDCMAGDRHLKELEKCGGVTVRQYVDTLLAVIERRVQV